MTQNKPDSNSEMMMMLREIKGDLEEIKGDLASMKADKEIIMERIEKQEVRLEYVEREMKRKNLILKGIKDEKVESFAEREGKVKEVLERMGVGMMGDIIDITKRIGPFNESRNRPILLKLITEKAKFEILKNTVKLKGTNIWIEEDYTKKIQEERKALIPKLKEIRATGKQAILKYNRIEIISENIEERQKKGKRTLEQRSPREDKLETEIGKTPKNYKISDGRH